MHFYAYLIISVLLILLGIILFNRFKKPQKEYNNFLKDISEENLKLEDMEEESIKSQKQEEKRSNCKKELIRNLDKSFEIILETYNFMEKESKNKREILPAAEWLLDNLYLIQKEYKDIKYNMPESYYKKLPIIRKGVLKGYPRIYYIALEMVVHTDGNIDGHIIKKFIKAYQKNTILSSGELWALPLMLKIATVQNISVLCEKIAFIQRERDKGEEVVEGIINAINENRLHLEILRLKSLDMKFEAYFVERLLKGLRDNAIDSKEVYEWIDNSLLISENNIEKILNLEHKKESSLQISIGNSINSLRTIEALNWKNYFEAISKVEEILREDPAEVYKIMDFDSRDYYRHEVEKLSKKFKRSEVEISEAALKCAKSADSIEGEEYLRHIGYYLVDKGIDELALEIFKDKKIKKSFEYKIKEKPLLFYLGTIFIGTILGISFFLSLSYLRDKNIVLWKYILASIVLIVPCSEITISILNWSITKNITPKFIPKLDFLSGIPEEYSSAVVIPTIINDEEKVSELIKNLEVYYLANEDRNLYFAILGDLNSCDTKVNKKDEKILKLALENIKKLNCKYFRNGEERFFFLCRERKFNSSEDKYLGWERKRGKIMEFNKLIRGDLETSFNTISSDISSLKKCKFVITLDSDTELPRDGAKKLIGAMSHILNIPHKAKNEKKIYRGYGLMQPRVAVGTLSANKSHFSKIFSGETGIDTYTTAVSDAYEDLFGEGIFTGKGIYHVDTFLYMLDGEIPENRVLSHDLLEGAYVRTSLITDVELIDGYPSNYIASCKRLHRWVRGDWQLIPWIFKKSPISGLAKWQIVDNLRRSLLSISIITLLILGLLNILPDGTDKWFLAAVFALISPILFDVSETVVTPIKGISLSGKVKSQKMIMEQIFLIFTFLPYQSYLMATAIIKTLFRMIFTKKHLLEWQTSEEAEKTSGKETMDFIKVLFPGSIIASVISILVFNKGIAAWVLMLPSTIIWFISPIIAYLVSKEVYIPKLEISVKDEAFLRRISRKTWAYFQDFVNEENNYLGPDNYQEKPFRGVAHRTSPTNIGMALTSNVVARDLGYIDFYTFLYRLEKITKSIDDLEKFNGHLYNWYDTISKVPLYPRFVSTVDSGNLVGYFWLCSEALKEYLDTPIIEENVLKGLNDTLKLAIEELIEGGHENIYNVHISLADYDNFNLKLLSSILEKIISSYNHLKRDDVEKFYWNRKLKDDAENYLNEIDTLFPWIDLLKESNLKDKLKETILNIPAKNSFKDLNRIFTVLSEDLKNENINRRESEALIESFLYTAKKFKDLEEKTKDIIGALERLAEETDFTVLYSKSRELFSIGYDIENDTLNNSYYDLLASESRQASFVAIAKGEVSEKHWFKLGRAMTTSFGSKALVSWTGTMFEYFMPLLIMKNYPETLLDETYKAVVKAQRKYAMQRKVPFGISESAYYNFDINENYQYKAFGVPGIGLKRGLDSEVVISPYATIMGLQRDFKDSLSNMYRLKSIGLDGQYGFYEAIDYTKDRIKKSNSGEIIKCFMIHHEGMSLMALDNVLMGNVLQKRFHNNPRVKATELLLQERVPEKVVYDREHKIMQVDNEKNQHKPIVRKVLSGKTKLPEVALLSNGEYSLMISNSGSASSKVNDVHLYRWREDCTEDNSGMFIYIKDINKNKFYSNTYAPTESQGKNYEVTFALDKVEFNKKEEDLAIKTEITLSSEENVELRRLTIKNNSLEDKLLEITSYCEVVLAGYDGDLVHPAFGNLFVTTEYSKEENCVLATRRPRAQGKVQPWMMQKLSVKNYEDNSIEFETNRLNFIGRNRNLKNPIDMEKTLDNTEGVVLDPIISIRKSITLKKGESIKMSFITSYGESKEEVLEIAKKYEESQNINRVFQSAYNQVNLELKYLGIKSKQANIYQSMASKILFISDSLRKREDYIKNINKSQNALWAYGISGDLPIILLIISEEKHIEAVRQILSAHEYLSLKGLKVDLVIINEEESSYHEPLQGSVMDTIYGSHARDKQNISGGVFVYNKARISEEDIELLKAIARLVLDPRKGPVLNQAISREEEIAKEDLLEDKILLEEKNNSKISTDINIKDVINKLEYYNEYGGFDIENNEYVITLNDGKSTPAPWINVISNGDFGFHVSESGSAYTWAKNSREFKITPWSNDFIKDTPSEILYIRDNESKKSFNLSKSFEKNKGDYIVKHGFGYSTFIHEEDEIYGEMTMFSSMKENVKIHLVKLKNNSSRNRNLSILYYAQLVLGVTAQHEAQHIYTELFKENKFIYGRNPYSMNFNKYYSYLKFIGAKNESFTGSREEFIGRGLDIENPKALNLNNLSNTVGAGMEPCLSSMGNVDLEPGETIEVAILFGVEESLENIDKVINKYTDIKNIERTFENVKIYWKDLLGHVQIKTPDKTMDLLVNGWLMYQSLVCRIWARTAFYQSGGAYGFRDQLQDVMSLNYFDPKITRKQILYSASRQFLEGDVQHWWHPYVDSGIRTRFSDDLLWLPYVTIDYIKNTGDYSILDEEVSYLEDEPLREGEDERYNIARKSEEKASLYEHCIRAIERGLNFGVHNIPLMGSGDWNDGMSTVGNKGKGESVWLGWFLYSILQDFKKLCTYKKDEELSLKYEKMQEFIRENLEKNAWDGKWYRRAYFDDGTPLGSHKNEECKIDSLSQSWSVISGAGNKERVETAMDSLEKYLVKRDKGLILLLTPPFYKSNLEPGYIKGYVPGVRENGGQYTHAATWVILAMTKLNRGDEAVELFDLINPINHCLTKEKCDVYKTEPYVMSADVYAEEPHIGRGGWSWYTGTAGWMYRACIEGILGLKLMGDRGFAVDPHIPKAWNEFEIIFKREKSTYKIQVKKVGKKEIYLNGELLKENIIPYYKEGEFEVLVTI